MSTKDKIELFLKKWNQNSDWNTLLDDQTKDGEDLHRGISRLVNSSHVVVPIITKEWLNSNETRDELVRAHERRKYIISLFKSDGEITENDLPFFLRPHRRIHFTDSNIEEKLSELCRTLDQFNSHWLNDPYNNIRLIGDTLQKSILPPIQKRNHVSNILKKAKQDIISLLESNEYKTNVTIEENFLESATPYYQYAESIYAISITGVSTFWTEEKALTSKEKYLNAQSGIDREVVRLFVFQNPNELNSYKNILHANYLQYGRGKGGVFICSEDSYKKLISIISRDRRFTERCLDQDFAILRYKNEKGFSFMEAALDTTELKMSDISMDNFEYSTQKETVEILKSFLTIEEGEYNSEFKIFRWSNREYKKESSLEKAINYIFPVSNEEMIHLLCVDSSDCTTNVTSSLENLKSNLDREAESLGIIKTWIGTSNSLNAVDGRFHGKLEIDDCYDLILAMHFDSRASAQAYYTHRIHSIERQALYEAINPDSKVLYQKIEDLGISNKSRNIRIEICEQIEKLLSSNIKRMDFISTDSASAIVKRKGLPFGSHKK